MMDKASWALCVASLALSLALLSLIGLFAYSFDPGPAWVHNAKYPMSEPTAAQVKASIEAANRPVFPECVGHQCDKDGFLIASPTTKRKVARECPDANPLYVEAHGTCPGKRDSGA